MNTKGKYVATLCAFSLYVENWNEGEGKCISAWEENITPSGTIIGVLRNVPYIKYDICFNKSDNDQPELKFINDPNYENDYNRFSANVIVQVYNDSICKPTEQELIQFKNGEINLYSLHVTLKIQKIYDLDISDIPICCIN